MKNLREKALLFGFLLMTVSIFAQDQNVRLMILPFDANGIDPVYVNTAQSILRMEIGKLSQIEILSEDKTNEILGDTDCFTTDCAINLGEQAGVTQVAGCRLAVLGERIIVQYFLVDVKSKKPILMDQVTAVSIEDLDPVMKRIASNIVEMKTTEENAQVGTIVEAEAEKPLRRSSRKNIGLSFGYLFPQNGYDNNDEKSFTINLHLDYELQDLAVGLLLGARNGFAMNVYGEYLVSRTDICPYVGGAFGFHWVSHEHPQPVLLDPYNTVSVVDKKSDGFELTLNTGFRLLHTYNFQILLNLEYIMTFNDYDDKAIVFTIGIL